MSNLAQRIAEIRKRAASNTGPSFGYTHQLTMDIEWLIAAYEQQGREIAELRGERCQCGAPTTAQGHQCWP